MNTSKNFLSNAGTVVLVLCALAMTAMVAHREFAAPPPAGGIPYVHIKDGRSYAESGHVIGPANAKVQLVEFSDFQCPYCRKLNSSLRELQVRHPGQISVRFRHFPLAFHEMAMPAAIAAECAAAQGNFETFANTVFDHQDSLSNASLRDYAARSGVRDLSQFDKCRSDTRVTKIVDNDIAAGRRLDLQGTPALLLGDEMIGGAAPTDSIEAWITRRSK